VDENGDKVSFKYDKSKTYYLDYEATDVLGNKIYNKDALDSTLYTQKVFTLNVSNTSLMTIDRVNHPKDNTRLAFRINLIAAQAPDYDTPITFMASAPFAGKNSNLTVTLYRAAAVETFKMQHPAETASQGKAIEIPFEAFDQAGVAITAYDDLVDKVQFSASEVGFVRQSDGTAKLYGTFAAEQTYYITSTVKGSLTGSFSQISVRVKETAEAASINALAHSKAYLPGAIWDTIRVSSFTVKDQFDRDMNLRSDAQGNSYAIRVSSNNSNVMNLTGGGTIIATGTVVTYEITGDQAIDFVAGSRTGTATLTYQLIDKRAGQNNKVIDTASAVAYNLELKDVKSLDLQVEDKAIYMADNDVVAEALQLGVANELANDIDVFGKTSSGMEVRLPAGVWYTLTDDVHFSLNSDNDVRHDLDYTNNDSTGSTVLTAHYMGNNGVLADSATINASNAAPVVSEVKATYNNKAKRDGKITVINDVVQVGRDYFNSNLNFVGRSIYKYTKAGIKNTTDAGGSGVAAAQIYFEVVSQYGAWVPENTVITPATGNTGTLSVNTATGVLSGAVAIGDEYTVTVLATNGKAKVIRFKIVADN
jgi:hypothetical protein